MRPERFKPNEDTNEAGGKEFVHGAGHEISVYDLADSQASVVKMTEIDATKLVPDGSTEYDPEAYPALCPEYRPPTDLANPRCTGNPFCAQRNAVDDLRSWDQVPLQAT